LYISLAQKPDPHPGLSSVFGSISGLSPWSDPDPAHTNNSTWDSYLGIDKGTFVEPTEALKRKQAESWQDMRQLLVPTHVHRAGSTVSAEKQIFQKCPL
jgi:hypothetical protein